MGVVTAATAYFLYEVTLRIGAVAVPVNVGDARLAFNPRAVVVAVETGLLRSVVLSTLPRPTIDAVIPLTVPVKVGEARGAFSASLAIVAYVEAAVAVVR
jgi:hypothetical protein